MRTILAILLALAASLPLASQARARAWTDGDLTASHGDSSPASSSFAIEPFAYEFTGSEQYSFAVASLLSLASVSARIDHGWARVVGAASGSVDGAPANQRRQGSAAYSVRAGFDDTITIDAPGLTGQTGTVRIGMDVEGVVSAGADWWPGQSAAVSLGAATIRFFGPGLSARRVAEVRNPAEPPDYYSAETIEGFLGGTAHIVFGTPFPIEFSVFLWGNADAISNAQPGVTGAPATATMVGDFRNTFGWAGIAELRDAGGAPVLDFTVTSLSGTDYRDPIVPVPEAGTSLPALAGLAGLTWRSSSRRSGRAS